MMTSLTMKPSTDEDKSEHGVTPEEAAHQLVNAIVLQGALDYRDALFNSITFKDGDYAYRENDTIRLLEEFFQGIGFAAYDRLRPRVLAFRREIDTLKFENRNQKIEEKSFICPLCKGKVHVINCKYQSKHNKTNIKKAACDTCYFKVYI